MWHLKQLVAASAMVALVGTGCATQRGSGVSVKGSRDVQRVTAQVDVLEVAELKQKQGSWMSTVKTPFVWIKEHPKQSITSVLVGALGYLAYDEWIDDGGSSTAPAIRPIEGITQKGDNNKVVIKDAEGQPDIFQDGQGNVVEIDVSVEGGL